MFPRYDWPLSLLATALSSVNSKETMRYFEADFLIENSSDSNFHILFKFYFQGVDPKTHVILIPARISSQTPDKYNYKPY